MASFMFLCLSLGTQQCSEEMIAVLALRTHADDRNRNRIPPVDVNPKNSTWRPTGIFTISLFSDKKSKLNINRRLVDVRVSPSGC